MNSTVLSVLLLIVLCSLVIAVGYLIYDSKMQQAEIKKKEEEKRLKKKLKNKSDQNVKNQNEDKTKKARPKNKESFD